MSPEQVERSAQRLVDAERSGQQIALLSLEFPDAGIAEAYAIQAALVARKIAAGRRRIGWKVGLTSKAMQQALDIDTPDSGVLFDDMLFANGAAIPPGRFIQPRVEAEISFVFKGTLEGPGVTADDVIAATEYVVPSLEILDTRIERVDAATGRKRTIVDTIADNAANAGIVVGDQRARPDGVDPRWIGAIVSRNAIVEETGLGAGVLGHPATSVAWLINQLSQYGGGPIAPGEIVLSGSFIRPIEARAADTIRADFGPLGAVSVHFL